MKIKLLVLCAGLMAVAACSSGTDPLSMADQELARRTSPPAPNGDPMFVKSVRAGWYQNGGTHVPIAYVEIVDTLAVPIIGATVVGTFSGCVSQKGATAITEEVTIDSVGTPVTRVWARVVSSKAYPWRNCDCMSAFTVTDVRKDGMQYEPSRNVMTTDDILCGLP